MLNEMGIEFCFAELKDPVKDKLKRFGLFAQLGENYFFPTVGAAVSRYLEINSDVHWEDWEDQIRVMCPVCPLLALSGHAWVHCTCLLLTQADMGAGLARRSPTTRPAIILSEEQRSRIDCCVSMRQQRTRKSSCLRRMR